MRLRESHVYGHSTLNYLKEQQLVVILSERLFFAILSAISCVRKQLVQTHENFDVKHLNHWKE
jgi:hypothetical protein